MNERIKELMDEAVRFRLDPDSKQYEAQVSPDDLEVFAELIVKECAHVAVFKDSGTVATAQVAGYMAAGRSISARLIQEHFGVEE